MAATVTVENFFAREADLDGPVQQERGLGHDNFVIKRIALAAKTSAIRRGDHANVRRRHLQNLGERAVKVVRRLRTGPDGQLPFGVFDGNGSMLLDGQMSAALVEKSVLEDFVRFGERFLNVPELQRDALVNVSFFAVIVNPRRGCR